MVQGYKRKESGEQPFSRTTPVDGSIKLVLSCNSPLVCSRSISSPLLQDFNAFMAEFEAVFGDSDKARTSANKLRRLQQGTCSAIVYASEFRQLACDVNWGEAALIDQFRCGLRDDVQNLLLTLADPSSFSEAIT